MNYIIATPGDFDPHAHGYDSSTELLDFNGAEGWEMGVKDGREEAIMKIQHPGNCESCGHRSDCSLHNRPAEPVEPCDCGKALGE